MSNNNALRIIDNDDIDIIETNEVQVLGDITSQEFSFDALVKMADQAPAIASAMRKIQLASITATNPQDWVDQSGKPYLQSSGSEKTAALWGISWQILKQEKTIKDDSYIWTTILRISAPRMGRTIEILGTRSSSDPFFGIRGGVAMPVDKIDEASVRKSSYTNALARGVQIILGLRNLTWEELGQHGISRSGVASIQRTTKTAATPEDGEHKTELWNILLEISGNDQKQALATLESITEFKGRDGNMVAGVKGMSALKDKRLNVALGKARDMHKIFLSDMEQGKQDEPEAEDE